MKKIFWLAIFFCFSCTSEKKDPSLLTSYDKKIAEIGLPVNLLVEIDDLGKIYTLEKVEWSDKGDWLKDSSNVILKSSYIDTLSEKIEMNYEITFWDTGRYVIPPLNIEINFPDSIDVSKFASDSSSIFIGTILDSTMTSIIEDKPLKIIDFPIQKLRIFALLLLIGLSLYVMNIFNNRESKKNSKRNFFNINPKKSALKKSGEIDFKNLTSEELSLEVSKILKDYFQNDYYIISFEMTSNELKEYFKDDELNKLLDKLDLVKFSKQELSKLEKKEIIDLLKKVIRKLL